MGTKITIADVAREAGVSTQTVSRVVNGKDEIRPKTRQKVLDVIERLGYRPNAVARSLATNRTSTLGLVVPDIGNPFFSEVVRGAEDAAREHGYHVFLCNTDQKPEREQAAIRALQDKWVDGIVLCSTRLQEDQLQEFIRGRQGIVLVSRERIDGSVGSVRVDDVRGTILAMNHLLASNRQNIAFLAGIPGGPSHRIRMQGFSIAVETAGLGTNQAIAVHCVSNPAGGYEATKKVLVDRPSLDGLVCFNDLVAIGALRACLEHGIRVPEDVAVVGFDDIALASLVQPPLTTVRRSKHELGAEAVKMLVDHLRGHDHEKEVVLEPELIVRGSAP